MVACWKITQMEDSPSKVQIPYYTLDTGVFITTADDNPLQGGYAFVNSSNGYSSAWLNLASPADGSVNFRWRIGTDFTNTRQGFNGTCYLGWLVGDVRSYVCNAFSDVYMSGLKRWQVLESPVAIPMSRYIPAVL